MDFGQAALLVLFVFVGCEIIRTKAPKLWARFDVLFALALGVVVVLGVAESDWAHQQIIGGRALDQLSIASRVIAGLLLGAGAVGFNVAKEAVSNIGQNKLSDAQQAAFDVMAQRQLSMQHPGQTADPATSSPGPSVAAPMASTPPAG